MIALPAGLLPVQEATTRKILYGTRKSRFRYELLLHDPTTGVDSLIGFLDGVRPGGYLSWSSWARVKKTCEIIVHDLPRARSGLHRIADIDPMLTRIRPVLIIDGLPEIQLGVYVLSATPDTWTGTGRTVAIEMHDKSIVLDEDAVDQTFVADPSVPVLTIVRELIESAGERIVVDGSDTTTLASPMVRPATTPKLSIVNDLLDAINYNALWVDGVGNYRATPWVRPAQRPIQYSMLNGDDGKRLVRELTSGEESIYSPEWSRDRDIFRVPNKVIARQAASGDAEPLSGVATNENPDSQFSYQRRGRWVVPPSAILHDIEVPDFSGEVDPDAATIAYLETKALQSLIAATAVQAKVTVRCLPIPLELLDALRFESSPAGIDARHTVQTVRLPLRFDALMRLELMEVVDL